MTQPVEDTARANDAGALVEYVRGVTHIFGVPLADVVDARPEHDKEFGCG